MTGTTALLIGRTGAVAGKDYPVTDTVRIGAARDAEIHVRAEGISRIHARLWQEGSDYWIEDAGSTNGTFLCGVRIRKDRIRHLDVVTLGRSIDLIFVIREGETVPATRPRTRSLISAALEPVDGPDAGTPIAIPQGEITLGRADSNNIVVSNRAISKVHARIERTPDVVTIQDLQSVNGTFVNDTRIESPVVLGRRDRICLAGVRTFTVTLERDGTATSGTSSSALKSGPLFSQEWKTRLVWSDQELAELAELAQPTPAPPPEPEKPAKKRAAKRSAPAKPVPSAPAAPVAKASPAPSPASPVAKAAPKPKAVAAPAKPAAQALNPAPPTPPRGAAIAVAPPPPVVEPQPTPPPPEVPKKPAGGEPTVFASAPPVTPRQVRLSGATPHTLEPGTTTVGRAVTATLRIDDRKASRAHAEIVVAADEVAIEDKGSVNGTFVNGRVVVARQPLVSGDRIKIGDTEWTVEIS